MTRLPHTCIAVLLAVLGLATAAQADNLSAPAAAAALASGALAWDVREQPAPGLPGALRIPADVLRGWLQGGDHGDYLAALQAAVSQAGLDLSREIVVYGDAGDSRAQALVDSLQSLSRGRVHWLVGGVPEWRMSGRALGAAGQRPPVPQRLLAEPGAGAARMAGAALRGDRPDTLLASR